jgi:hypothetical protein
MTTNTELYRFASSVVWCGRLYVRYARVEHLPSGQSPSFVALSYFPDFTYSNSESPHLLADARAREVGGGLHRRPEAAIHPTQQGEVRGVQPPQQLLPNEGRASSRSSSPTSTARF